MCQTQNNTVYSQCPYRIATSPGINKEIDIRSAQIPKINSPQRDSLLSTDLRIAEPTQPIVQDSESHRMMSRRSSRTQRVTVDGRPWASNAISNCSDCRIQFRFLMKRKHHCRFCGQIFCGKCSSHLISANNKRQRACNGCASTQQVYGISTFIYTLLKYGSFCRNSTAYRDSLFHHDCAAGDSQMWLEKRTPESEVRKP